MTDAEIASTAMTAVSTTASIASTALTVIGVIVAIAAIFGFLAVTNEARRAAEGVAKQAVNDYLGSAEFKQEMERLIAKRVAEKTLRSPADEDDEDPFPNE